MGQAPASSTGDASSSTGDGSSAGGSSKASQLEARRQRLRPLEAAVRSSISQAAWEQGLAMWLQGYAATLQGSSTASAATGAGAGAAEGGPSSSSSSGGGTEPGQQHVRLPVRFRATAEKYGAKVEGVDTRDFASALGTAALPELDKAAASEAAAAALAAAVSAAHAVASSSPASVAHAQPHAAPAAAPAAPGAKAAAGGGAAGRTSKAGGPVAFTVNLKEWDMEVVGLLLAPDQASALGHAPYQPGKQLEQAQGLQGLGSSKALLLVGLMLPWPMLQAVAHGASWPSPAAAAATVAAPAPVAMSQCPGPLQRNRVQTGRTALRPTTAYCLARWGSTAVQQAWCGIGSPAFLGPGWTVPELS